jgi:hypothetical protein
MDPQKLPPLYELTLQEVRDQSVCFTTSGGALEISFWDEDILRLRLGEKEVNTYPIIVGQPSGKPVSHSVDNGIHYIRCEAGEVQVDPGKPEDDTAAIPISFTF